LGCVANIRRASCQEKNRYRKKIRRAFFVAKKFEKDYLKFFPILQRENFFIGLRESTRKMSYGSAWRPNCFQLVLRKNFPFLDRGRRCRCFYSLGGASRVINSCG
jgi:hypothetical protein